MIGTCNINNKLFNNLSKTLPVLNLDDSIDKKVDGIIIEWIKPSNDEKSIKQIQLIQNNIKKIPIIIIDKNMVMENKEYNWLKKFNVKLYEPAIKNRECFDFLPDFIDFSEIKELKEYKKHEIAYENDVITDGFEKYYCLLSSKHGVKIPCKIHNITKEKKEVYKKLNIDFNLDFDWKDVSTTIVIGSKKDYKIGNLNVNLFNKIQYGCLPLIPEEHRFFGSVMETLIKNYNDIFFYIGYNNSIKKLLLDDIFNRFKKYYPEFTSEYQCEEISNFFKGE
jgi:hypothetical protein